MLRWRLGALAVALFVCATSCIAIRDISPRPRPPALRAGVTTVDQAIVAMGPPESVQQLADGSQILRWTGRRDERGRIVRLRRTVRFNAKGRMVYESAR